MNSKAQNPSAPQPGLLGKVRTPNRSIVEIVQDLGLVVIIVICSILLGLASPVFFKWINIENLLFGSTIIAIVAIGEAFVIMVAGIDLSVGAVLALSSVLCVGLAVNQGLPAWLAALIALGLGAVAGLINGVAVTRFKIPALIATLAMMSIARGVAFIYSGGRNIAPIPDIYDQIQAAHLFGVPVIILFTLAIALIAHFVLSSTRFGREIYATGGNPVAATLSGIRADRVIISAYLISGIAAALGGLMITARLEAGAATAGFGMELTVISAAVIGGVSLFGGEGKIGSVLLGVLLLGLVQNAINLLNVPPNYDYVVSGLVIALAAALDVFRRNVAEAGARRRSAAVKKEQARRASKAAGSPSTP
jgi:ribose transport system permease protein